MLLFWIIAAAIVLISAAVLLRPLLSDGTSTQDVQPDIGVYRDQLKEVDRDLARNVITAPEAEALRTEVSRRLLAASDTATGPANTPNGASQVYALGLVSVVLIAGVGVYAMLGQPGAPDQPLAQRIAQEEARRAARPSQSAAETFLAENGEAPPVPEPNPEHLALLDKLREVLAENPDPRGQRLLASNLARLGRWQAAHEAQAKAIEMAADDASGADYVDFAEYMILAVNGYVSPQAEDALRAAMERVPSDPRARYYSGLLAAQAGRPDITWSLWTRLLAEGPDDAPWITAIQSQIADVAAATGQTLPNGPSQQQINDAAEMSSEDRAAFIENMVSQLAERLSAEGGPPQDWAQLIRALGVQGKISEATETWAKAQAVFADDPEGLALIQQAAIGAGVAE